MDKSNEVGLPHIPFKELQGTRYQWKWNEETKFWHYCDGPNAVIHI